MRDEPPGAVRARRGIDQAAVDGSRRSGRARLATEAAGDAAQVDGPARHEAHRGARALVAGVVEAHSGDPGGTRVSGTSPHPVSETMFRPVSPGKRCPTASRAVAARGEGVRIGPRTKREVGFASRLVHTFASGDTLRTMSTELYEWGPVVVLNGAGVERIGYYDNDEWVDDGSTEGGQSMAVVSYSETPFMFGGGFHLVSKKMLRPVDTDSLFRRRDALAQELYRTVNRVVESEEPYDLLLEWAFVNSLLATRMVEARGHEGAKGGKRVFISHSSKDKPLAISISVDIASRGHLPWLDEWQIVAGESIPVKIGEGLENSDYEVFSPG